MQDLTATKFDQFSRCQEWSAVIRHDCNTCDNLPLNFASRWLTFGDKVYIVTPLCGIKQCSIEISIYGTITPR